MERTYVMIKNSHLFNIAKILKA